tara:strand:+ start:73 stop:279 length:207 start_codon:yes stop_codon:yes gene_type:complete
MKFKGSQAFDVNWLKGQLIINPNGGEFFIKNIHADVIEHEILIELDDGSEMSWENFKDWEIQFQGGKL